MATRSSRVPKAGDVDRGILLQGLLLRTSRTFALSIPLLPWPVERDVTVAYLLFRIADTIEDGERLSTADKAAAFREFDRVLGQVADGQLSPRDGRLTYDRPSDNEDYAKLFAHASDVLEAACDMDAPVRAIVVRALRESMQGMNRFVQQSRGCVIHLRSLEELREYCYHVAGIVGEMLTEIFLEHEPLHSASRERLLAKSRFFGEGLQLVNILKDAQVDADAGRHFLPRDIPRDAIFQLAREDLQQAEDYVRLLTRDSWPDGYRAFAELPVRLAIRSLECIEADGPGSKVPRSEVAELLHEVKRSGMKRRPH